MSLSLVNCSVLLFLVIPLLLYNGRVCQFYWKGPHYNHPLSSPLSLHQSNITFLLNPSTRLLRLNDHLHNQNIIIIIVRIIINNNNYKLGARTSSFTPPDNYKPIRAFLPSSPSSPSKYIRIRICYKEIFSCPPPVTFHHTTVNIIIIILWISYTA